MTQTNTRTFASLWIALATLLILGGSLPRLAHATPWATRWWPRLAARRSSSPP